jgi:sigma-B regulation protein RsbU (phosphoserine phosphatase)
VTKDAAPERLLDLRFPARADQLCEVRDAVRACIFGIGAGEECINDVVLAVDEACQNVIRHAYGGKPGGEIRLRVDRLDDELVFSLRDFAPKVDPAKVKPRDLDDLRPGGLGTHLIQSVMDRAEFVNTDAEPGNLFRMVKRIA